VGLLHLEAHPGRDLVIDPYPTSACSSPGAIVPERGALAAASQAAQTLLDTYRAYLKHCRTCGACANLRVTCKTGQALWQAHTAAQVAMRPNR